MLSILDFWRKRQPKFVYSYIPEPTYRQKDPEQMVEMATQQIGNWEASGSNVPPVFVPDFGTVTMARPWGGLVKKTDDGQIFIDPVSGNIDEILDIEPAPNGDIQLAVDLYNEVKRRTGRDDIRFVTPDYQGVLGTASQIMAQEELMVAMYTDGEKVHKFLDLVCRRNIQFMKDLQAKVRVDGNVWPYIWLPQEIGVVVTEDFMPLLSPEMYRDFGMPYLRRMGQEFGAVFIHSCGSWIQHAEMIRDSTIPYLGVDHCYPYTKLEDIQAVLPNWVLQPGYEFFKTLEYADFPAYLDAMIQKRQGDTCLWPAINSNAVWKYDQVRKVLDKHRIDFEGFCR